MKRILGILLVGAFASLPFYWDKTREPNYATLLDAESGETEFPPLVLATSLKDSLPENIIDLMGLGEVTGTKLRYRSGEFSCYYHYSADHQKFLSALALIPVPLQDQIADTSYRLLTTAELKDLQDQIPVSEAEVAAGFWKAAPEQFRAIESIKPPFKHVILLSKTDQRIVHRVTSVI